MSSGLLRFVFFLITSYSITVSVLLYSYTYVCIYGLFCSFEIKSSAACSSTCMDVEMVNVPCIFALWISTSGTKNFKYVEYILFNKNLTIVTLYLYLNISDN